MADEDSLAADDPVQEDDDDRLGLMTMIRALRSELWRAAEEGSEEQLRFDVGPIDLELDVAVTKAGKGEAGVRFYVFTLSGGGSYESAHTQKLRLQLTPKTAGGSNVQVGDVGTGLPNQGQPNQQPDP